MKSLPKLERQKYFMFSSIIILCFSSIFFPTLFQFLYLAAFSLATPAHPSPGISAKCAWTIYTPILYQYLCLYLHFCICICVYTCIFYLYFTKCTLYIYTWPIFTSCILFLVFLFFFHVFFFGLKSEMHPQVI